MEGGCGWGRLTGDGEEGGFEKGQNGNSGKRRIHHRVYKLSPSSQRSIKARETEFVTQSAQILQFLYLFIFVILKF